MALRFAVGTRVICKLGEWRACTIICLNYKEDDWPLGMVVPYEVELDDNEYSQTYGSFIQASDDDSVIRLASFQNYLNGFEWADQFIEERRCDGSFNRNLKEFLEYWTRYNLQIQDIMQAWDLLPVFMPEPIAKAAAVQEPQNEKPKGQGKGKGKQIPEPIAKAAAVQAGIPGTVQQPRQEPQKESQETQEQAREKPRPRKEPTATPTTHSGLPV